MSMGYSYPQQGPSSYPQQQMQQQIAPWAQQLPEKVPAQLVVPPSFEGTALAGVVGAVATAVAVKGGMIATNLSPASFTTEAAILGLTGALGGLTSSLVYRQVANQRYREAQYTMGMSGILPNQAARELRLGVKIGHWGNLQANIPSQFLHDAADAWNKICEPHRNTPSMVDKYFGLAAESKISEKEQEFMQCMSPPNACMNPAPQQPPQPQHQCGFPPQAR